MRGYEVVSTDDDEIEMSLAKKYLPLPNSLHNEIRIEPPRSNFCMYILDAVDKSYMYNIYLGLWVLLTFSISGVVFLSIIAYLLQTNSVYIKVGKENEDRKPTLSEGVIGAAVMYAVTACIVLYYLYKSHKMTRRNVSAMDDHNNY